MKNLIILGCVAFALWGVYACTQTPVTPDETTATVASARAETTSGTALSGLGSLTTVAITNLPAVISRFISTSYAGASIKEAKVSATGVFVVLITVNSATKVLVFGADGTFKGELTAGRHHEPHSGTATRPGNGTATRPHNGTLTHPHSGTVTRPGNGTATHPHNGTATRPGSGTATHPHNGTAGPGHRPKPGKPGSGTGTTPASGTQT